jgi:hypothetical protein
MPVSNQLLPTSVGRFLVLTYATLGLYLAYWIFETWVGLSALDGKRRWPGLRTLFAPFITWSALGGLRRMLPGTAGRTAIPLEVFGLAFGLMLLAPQLLRDWPILSTALSLAAPFALTPAVQAVNSAARIQGATVPTLSSMGRPELVLLSGGVVLWLILLA